MSAPRLLSIDILRGLSIASILVIHRIHYQWSGMQTREILRANMDGPWVPLIILTIVLFTMAGIFYFLTGIVNAYAIHQRVSGNSCKRRNWISGGVISGMVLIGFSYLHRIFFVNGFIINPDKSEPEFPIGLLTGFIRDSDIVRFRWSLITEPGTLSLIGMIMIIVTLTLGWLFRKGQPINYKKVNLILSLLTIAVLAVTPFMKYWLRPEYDVAYQTGHYLKACFLGHICQEFCLFPYLGYGFFGAITGISLARGERRKLYLRRSRIWMISLVIVGMAGIFLFDRSDPFGRRFIGASVSYVELAIFILMLNTLLRLFDFCSEENKQKRWKRSLGLRRIGMVALTVYFFEAFVAEILKSFIDFITGNNTWTNSFPLVLLFGFACLTFWWYAVSLWSRFSFTGSLEMLTARLLLKLSGKKSTKTDLTSIQNKPASLE